jgi:hypothetical protein
VKKGKKHRWRPSKCWLCEKRHPQGDPVCPMERRDPEGWKEKTKFIGDKEEVFAPKIVIAGKPAVFGKKTVFVD